MKNLILYLTFALFLISCGKEESSTSDQNCEGANGTISGVIDGVELADQCFVGSLMTIEDQGFDLFVSGNFANFIGLDIESFSGFILSMTSTTGIKEECVNVSNGVSVSSLAGSETVVNLIYYQDVNFTILEEEQEAKFFDSANSNNFGVCIDEYDVVSGRLRGTFSGSIVNGLGQGISVTNGKFDYDFD